MNVDDGAYGRTMGRGQGNLQAAGIRRKPDVLGQIPTYRNLLRDAVKGDFAPFLDKAQEPDSDVVNPLLDGMVTQSVCMTAATQAKERLKLSLALRVRAAGITDAGVVDGIIDLAASAATADLRSALHAHVEGESTGARWQPLTGPEFEVQADAAVVNRVAQALGKPVDVALFAGTLVSRRRR